MSRALKAVVTPRHVRGIGLIEVMVSVLVLAVGLLGIAAMQAMALRGGQGSLENTQAVMATNSILEAIRANPTQAAAYNMGMTCAVPSGAGIVGNDQIAWISSLKTTIGSGATDTTTCGQISGCPAACVITVQWDDSRAGGGATRQISVRSQV